jgi:Dolichyl-phosphate-mannose-protein mannosyltransferase
MRRILVVSNGIGIQEKSGFYTNAYDHPFFGQLLVGSLMWLSGYPNFALEHTISSVELAIAFPRIIIGMFAIIDTFLIFKICQRVGSTRVALLASALFAVTPMIWHFRLVTLDNIAMPFLLSSILVSLSITTWNRTHNVPKHILLLLLSGTLLGLALLTKVPFITMIPLVGYLIYRNSNTIEYDSRLKAIMIWLIPIIIIPLLWPFYALSVGEFDLWEEGFLNQVERADRRSDIMQSFFSVDPVLLFLGLGGLLYSFVKRDWIIALWIIPFLIFVYAHGWFNPFHWVVVLPAFCIAAAKLIVDLVQRIKFNRIKVPATFTIVCIILIGITLFNTLSIISINVELDAIRGIADSLDYMDKADGVDDDKINDKITVVTRPAYSWIYKYVYNMNYTIDTAKDIGIQKIQTNKTIIYQDNRIEDILNQLENKFSSFVLDLGKVREICNLDIEWRKTGYQSLSPITVTTFENEGSPKNAVFNSETNKTNNPQILDLKNMSARFINFTSIRDNDETNDAITKITVYGKDKDKNECNTIPIEEIKFKDNSVLFNSLDNYDVVASYKMLFNDDINLISVYKTKTSDLNDFTKVFTQMRFWPSRHLELLANY